MDSQEWKTTGSFPEVHFSFEKFRAQRGWVSFWRAVSEYGAWTGVQASTAIFFLLLSQQPSNIWLAYLIQTKNEAWEGFPRSGLHRAERVGLFTQLEISWSIFIPQIIPETSAMTHRLGWVWWCVWMRYSTCYWGVHGWLLWTELYPPQIHISPVQFSHSIMSNSLQPHESQHTRLPCPSQTSRVYSDSCPSSRWCHPATPINSKVRADKITFWETGLQINGRP